jgi:hypothetical protein
MPVHDETDPGRDQKITGRLKGEEPKVSPVEKAEIRIRPCSAEKGKPLSVVSDVGHGDDKHPTWRQAIGKVRDEGRGFSQVFQNVKAEDRGVVPKGIWKTFLEIAAPDLPVNVLRAACLLGRVCDAVETDIGEALLEFTRVLSGTATNVEDGGLG